jgi:hypothetical protein
LENLGTIERKDDPAEAMIRLGIPFAQASLHEKRYLRMSDRDQRTDNEEKQR